MTEVTEWGRGLTAPFMKSLNLPGDTPVNYNGCVDDSCEWKFNGDKEYRLPADHFVYTVLDYNERHGTSFVPWAGAKPCDWDNGPVLVEEDSPILEEWGAPPARRLSFPLDDNWGGLNHLPSIIGYTRKEPATDEGEYVRVKMMTYIEAKRKYSGLAVYALSDLGIIAETPVECFKRENPGLTADELLAKALEYNK